MVQLVMVVRKKSLLIVAAIAALVIVGGGVWLRARPGCSIRYRLNPDVTCRVLDVRDDGTYLLQYFDADTNELRLYVQQNKIDTQIEHPYGKVKRFNAKLEQNEIKFNRDNYQTLIVNGEVFSITPKSSN